MTEQSVAVPREKREPQESREDRALILLESFGERIERVTEEPGVYIVPSQDGERAYRVEYGERESCECPDHTHRESTCVHIIALAIHLERKRQERAVRTRRILAEARERFNHELMDDEERMLLLDRIRRLRRSLALGIAAK